jgi:hypothetical protein
MFILFGVLTGLTLISLFLLFVQYSILQEHLDATHNLPSWLHLHLFVLHPDVGPHEQKSDFSLSLSSSELYFEGSRKEVNSSFNGLVLL